MIIISGDYQIQKLCKIIYNLLLIFIIHKNNPIKLLNLLTE